MNTKPKVAAIIGPTATGKTGLGIRLAKKWGGEIISGDSMLVFRRMDIATAKPTPEELAEVPHHLVDILEPSEKYSVVAFQEQADFWIRDCNRRGVLPILVGGTGLYCRALLEHYDFSTVNESKDLRKELISYAEENGNVALHKKLEKLNPKLAENLKVNDRKRIIRAIETTLGGDAAFARKAAESPYEAVVFGLTMERPVLYDRINRRVDLMVMQGLFAETKRLLQEGVPATCQSMKSIGYRQALQYFQGERTKEECINKIKQATRNFAKRQITWYKEMPYIRWLHLSDPVNEAAALKAMEEVLLQKRFI